MLAYKRWLVDEGNEKTARTERSAPDIKEGVVLAQPQARAG